MSFHKNFVGDVFLIPKRDKFIVFSLIFDENAKRGICQ